MAVLTGWMLDYSGPQMSYYYTMIDGPNAGTVYTDEFPHTLKPGIKWLNVSLYNANDSNFASNCSLTVWGKYVETDASGKSSEKWIQIAELIPAAAQGADPIIGRFEVEKYGALAYKFGVASTGDSSSDKVVVGLYI